LAPGPANGADQLHEPVGRASACIANTATSLSVAVCDRKTVRAICETHETQRARF